MLTTKNKRSTSLVSNCSVQQETLTKILTLSLYLTLNVAV